MLPVIVTGAFMRIFIHFQGWQPPFACDVDKLHFIPRIQRLNELEVSFIHYSIIDWVTV